jgi:alpha-galactosidase
MSALVTEYRIAHIKWDHNRPLVEAGQSRSGRPGVHQQTAATYRLMDELRSRHPELEIESCSAGGARLDLGILERTDRVWVSDCIDAHERHRLVRWTGLLLPPEVMGTHIGAATDQTTHRRHPLDFRAATAIWGHFGVEWDLTLLDENELASLSAWVQLYRELRDLLHHGDVVHADLTNPALQLDGVVSSDRKDALYRLTALEQSLSWPPGRVSLPGLDLETTYEICVQRPGGDHAARRPGWPAWTETSVSLSGRLLAQVGLQSPMLNVDESVLIRARAR